MSNILKLFCNFARSYAARQRNTERSERTSWKQSQSFQIWTKLREQVTFGVNNLALFPKDEVFSFLEDLLLHHLLSCYLKIKIQK